MLPCQYRGPKRLDTTDQNGQPSRLFVCRHSDVPGGRCTPDDAAMTLAGGISVTHCTTCQLRSIDVPPVAKPKSKPLPWPHEAFLEPYLFDGDTCINVGANDGYWVQRMAPRFRQVIAIEPSPVTAARLRERSAANVQVIEAAAWHEAGSVPFHAREKWHLNSAVACVDILPPTNVQHINVQAITIDSLSLTRCDLMWIDVEGAEVQVISGAAATIKRHCPEIVVECHRPEYRRWVTETLDSWGYNVLTHHEPHRPLNDNWGHHVYLIGTHYQRSRRQPSLGGLAAVSKLEDFERGEDPGRNCPHRLPVLRAEECELCSMHGRMMPVFGCHQHGECSPFRFQQSNPIRDCRSCRPES